MRSLSIRVALLSTLFVPASALAGERVSLFSGDLAVTYGRNWSQELNVGGLVGELKVNVLPYASVGVRSGGTVGGAIGQGAADASARAYVGVPVMLKVEGSPFVSRTRPFVGVGVGVTRAAGGGATAATTGATAEASSYTVNGAVPTLMPEVGVDLGALRVSLVHSALVGSAGMAEGETVSAGSGGATTGSFAAPGLSGSALQVGLHLGGPKKQG